MRPGCLLPALMLSPLCGLLTAQVQRLVDTIEAPIAYLCLEAMPAAPNGERQPGPVQRLLTDPSLDALFAAPAPGSAGEGSARALALVRGVLGRSSGELEIALTGILPRGGQPLLVLRARLQRAEADQLQLALDRNELAEPKGRVGDRTTWRLRGNTASEPGQDVELALVGADLVVGNDRSALREVLEARPLVTAVAPTRKVLATDPTFVLLKKQLPVAPGALWLYGDWQRLGQRLAPPGDGVAGWMLDGLGSARVVMTSVAAAQADFTATLLLDFAAPPPRPERADRPERPGRPGPGRGGPPGGERGPHEHGPPGIDSWFAAVQPLAARTLLPDLPAAGLGGLVLSVDLAGLVGRSHEGSHLLRDLHRAFGEYGLDFERNVLARLGSRGTVQLHIGRDGDRTIVNAVYALRTKNKKAAADLFVDLRRVAEPAGLGTVSVHDSKDARERRTQELLELRGREPGNRGPGNREPGGSGLSLFVGAHDDSLLFAGQAEPLLAVLDELRRPARPRARQPAAATLAGLGDNVAGLFDVDLQPLFEQIANAFAGGVTGSGARIDLSALPKRHVGSLDLQRRDDGTVVRVRVLSSR